MRPVLVLAFALIGAGCGPAQRDEVRLVGLKATECLQAWGRTVEAGAAKGVGRDGFLRRCVKAQWMAACRNGGFDVLNSGSKRSPQHLCARRGGIREWVVVVDG